MPDKPIQALLLTRPDPIDTLQLNTTALILDRYLTREIAKPMLLGISLLVLLFAGYSSAVEMTSDKSGLLQPATIARLIFLNTLVALEVLLPTALYLSIVATLRRLYRDSEMAALSAAGIGEPRILLAVLKFSVIVALIVAAISIFGRPWAYKQSYQLEAEAAAEFNINRIQPGKFLELQDNAYVLFATGVDTQNNKLTGVFMQSEASGKSKIIYAQEATLPQSDPGLPKSVEFTNGYGYLLDRTGANDIVLKFKSLVMHLQEDPRAASRKRKAISTAQLSRSSNPKEIAEYQWRLSTPIATLLLAMLAVPLSRSAPRENRYTGFFIAILVYIALFNLASMARNWLEQDKIGALPGIWWVYILAFLVFLLLFYWPRLKRSGTQHASA